MGKHNASSSTARLILLQSLVAFGLFGCQEETRTFQAEELTIVDKQGNTLIRLGEQGGNGAITLYDNEGQVLVRLVARQAIYDVPAGGELSLWRPDEMLLFSVYPTQTGSGISMYSPGIDGQRRFDQPVLIIDTAETGEPRLRTSTGILEVIPLDAPD